MKVNHTLALSVAVVIPFAFACGTSGNTPPPPSSAEEAMPPQGATPNGPNQTSGGATPTAVVTPATADTSEEQPVRVLSARMTRSGPTSTQVTAQPSNQHPAGLEVSISNFPGTCTPTPSFEAEIAERQIILRELPPSGPVARCPGSHSLILDVRGVELSSGSIVIVQSRNGQERARGTVQPAAPTPGR